MTTATVTVKYVNHPKPGQKKGTIKAADGRIFGVWPDKLNQFQQNGTYEIDYDVEEWNGKTYMTVKVVRPVNQQQAQPGHNSGGNGGGGSAYTAKDEQIFVCGALNNAIAARAVEPTTVSMMAFVNAARETWRGTFGQNDQGPPY